MSLRYLSRRLYLNLKLKVQEGDLVNMFGGRVLDANQVGHSILFNHQQISLPKKFDLKGA